MVQGYKQMMRNTKKADNAVRLSQNQENALNQIIMMGTKKYNNNNQKEQKK